MAGKHQPNRQLIKRVAEIYEWLDSQIRESARLAGICDACGKCCDFSKFDHRLFVTPPELMYLAANLGAENVKPMTTGRCSYNIKGKCSVYEHRFSSCRIFSCKSDTDFQSRLSESAVEKFKAICEQFQIPYRYTDLTTAMDGFSVT